MDKSTARKSWALSTGMLGIVLAAILRFHWLTESGNWHPVVFAAVILVAMFLTCRSWINYFVGLLVAIFPLFHPLFLEAVSKQSLGLQGDGLVLLTCFGLILVWKLQFKRKQKVGGLIGSFAAVFCLGVLSWFTAYYSGLLTLMLVTSGLVLGGIFGLLQRKRNGKSASLLNSILCLVLGIGFPFACLYSLPEISKGIDWLSQHGVENLHLLARNSFSPDTDPKTFISEVYHPSAELSIPGFVRSDRSKWAWPYEWLVLGLMAFGILRSLRSGWIQFRSFEAPIAWVLFLFTVALPLAAVLNPQSFMKLDLVPLATLSILLSGFGIFNGVGAVLERIRLKPPGEEQDEEDE